jgi:hypothetical protein
MALTVEAFKGDQLEKVLLKVIMTTLIKFCKTKTLFSVKER